MPRWRGPSSIGGGSSDVATDPDPGDATSPTLRHFQELKSAPPRASDLADACSATKALAGDGPIAAPHNAAQDDEQASAPAPSPRSLPGEERVRPPTRAYEARARTADPSFGGAGRSSVPIRAPRTGSRPDLT